MVEKYVQPKVTNVSAAPLLPVPTKYTPSCKSNVSNPNFDMSAAVATTISRNSPLTSATREPVSVVNVLIWSLEPKRVCR